MHRDCEYWSECTGLAGDFCRLHLLYQIHFFPLKYRNSAAKKPKTKCVNLAMELEVYWALIMQTFLYVLVMWSYLTFTNIVSRIKINIGVFVIKSLV